MLLFTNPCYELFDCLRLCVSFSFTSGLIYIFQLRIIVLFETELQMHWTNCVLKWTDCALK